MTVTAWNNGKYASSGAGYGLRLDPADRNKTFQQSWSNVTLDLPNDVNGVQVRLSASFWRDCPELRSAMIGKMAHRLGISPMAAEESPSVHADSGPG
jgi:hypothetical protein